MQNVVSMISTLIPPGSFVTDALLTDYYDEATRQNVRSDERQKSGIYRGKVYLFERLNRSKITRITRVISCIRGSFFMQPKKRSTKYTVSLDSELLGWLALRAVHDGEVSFKNSGGVFRIWG